MKGRPVRGLFGGLILGILVDIDLVFGGVVKLSSVLLTILPLALLVIGLLLGLWAPLGRSGASGAPSASPPPMPATVPASPPPAPMGPEAAAAEPPSSTEDTAPI
jgi:hypothetical protein